MGRPPLDDKAAMRVVRDFPYRVREIEHCWIPMPDGCRLAARLWLPEGSDDAPVPAILEYIPYRKRGGTRWRDEPMHGYFAGHGYASVRVDIRGSGDSEGVLLDEYTDREQEDGLAVLRWIASQPWCDGSVGMIGKSWGGFSALQLAAHAPPELRAVIAVCASEDRYRTDAHYMGGCLLSENLVWGSVLFTLLARPPDPETVGEGWREMWLERLEHLRPFPALWMEHPLRDQYWERGSVGHALERIACPVYAVGGWADAYTSAVPRVLTRLRAPGKGLVGPWAHVYPHTGVPGPAIGFLQEALRWWDHWLRGIDRGIMAEPPLRTWMPHEEGGQRGRWVAERSWPSPRISTMELGLDGMVRNDGATGPVLVDSPATTGLAAGAWCRFGAMDGPGEQAEDDAGSAVFDSEPLTERLEILGAPAVILSVRPRSTEAQVAVRLCDVAPDGSSRRVTYGLLDLTHRDGHARRGLLEPGRPISVRIVLDDVAHAFAPGHRVRVAVSTAYWPVAWPLPGKRAVEVVPEGSALHLPVRRSSTDDDLLSPFEEPEGAPAYDGGDHPDPPPFRSVHRDPETGRTVVTQRFGCDGEGKVALEWIEPIALEVGHGLEERFSIHPDDPSSAEGTVRHTVVASRPGWRTTVETVMTLGASGTGYVLEAMVVAREGEGGREVFRKAWKRPISRPSSGRPRSSDPTGPP